LSTTGEECGFYTTKIHLKRLKIHFYTFFQKWFALQGLVFEKPKAEISFVGK